jgi:signal transduction histidine kinase
MTEFLNYLIDQLIFKHRDITLLLGSLIFLFIGGLAFWSIWLRFKLRLAMETHDNYVNLVFTNAPFEILHLDPEFNVKTVNKSGIKYFEGDIPIGENFLKRHICVHDHDKFIEMATSCALPENDNKCEGAIRIRLDNRKKAIILCRLALLPDGDYLLFGYDISHEREKAQWKLQQQKIDSISMFASGLTNDLNNVLQVITSYVELQLSELSVDETNIENIKKTLNIVQNKCGEAGSLLQSLWLIAQDEPIDLLPFPMSDLLEDICEVLKDMECDWVVEDNLWKLYANLPLFKIAIQHLIKNSEQAVPKGRVGKVSISAENLTIHPGERSHLPHGNYVRLIISDNGTGIPPEFIDKIFDPFFTTKMSSNGLGLTIAVSIIKKHNGFIVVDSEPGEGTKVNLFFPAVTQDEGSG